MTIQTTTETAATTIALKDVSPGKGVVRFSHYTHQEAAENQQFWCVVNAPEVKAGRVRLFNPETGEQLERDDDHRVVVHDATLQIKV